MDFQLQLFKDKKPHLRIDNLLELKVISNELAGDCFFHSQTRTVTPIFMTIY